MISRSLANTIRMSRFFLVRGDDSQINFLIPTATSQINHLKDQIQGLSPDHQGPLVEEAKEKKTDLGDPPKTLEEISLKFLNGDHQHTWQHDLLAHSG
jgi:hypothetical protein